MKTALLSLHYSPLLPDPWLYGLIGLTTLLLIISLYAYPRGLIGRALCVAAFFLVLYNPSFVEENRIPVENVATIVVDQSPSQNDPTRTERTAEALTYLKAKLEKEPQTELRIVHAPENSLAEETRLFESLDNALSDVSPTRRAGIFILTDGQIHDVPDDQTRQNAYGPVHVLLTGDKNERDRRLKIIEAPAYGIVGKKVTIRYRIEDTANDNSFIPLYIQRDDARQNTKTVPVNEDLLLTLSIDHAGQNIIHLRIPELEGEITTANNQFPLIINGVRDRLRVLLVSGKPHAGGRAWRDLLTADPSVDLVHFTILREPHKFDTTPRSEMSLITFPVDELFREKLYSFDLVVFDRYKLSNILPQFYFENIAQYVEKGGAFLEASGPSYATGASLYRTPLRRILPAPPTAKIYEEPFKPTLTDIGKRHPVTSSLTNHDWGSWLRQIGVAPTAGDVLISGIDDNPLLILNRVGEGRVAQIASDHIWLWARGYEGGGPQTDLLRRVVHWLMKEPALEEDALDILVDGQNIHIEKRSLESTPTEITITSPSQKQKRITLEPDDNGNLKTIYKADELGVYTINAGDQQRFALVGNPNPPELQGVITTEDHVKDIVSTSGGSILWLKDQPEPNIRQITNKGPYAGKNWLGLRQNDNYTVTGVKEYPALPAFLAILLVLGTALFAWWREGRN